MLEAPQASAVAMKHLLLLAAGLFAAALASGAAEHEVGRLRLIGEQRLPGRQSFRGTMVGGLSGLDYDPVHDRWIAESDDKSEHGAARFYRLRLVYDGKAFASVEVTDVVFFRQPDGSLYPDKPHAQADGGEVPDIESIRFDPADGSVWYSSEGDRPLGMNPFVRHATSEGRFLFTLPQPPIFRIDAARELGPRHNLSFEGLTFSPDGRTLWVAMEAPVYQDGPVPTPQAGAMTRITHYERAGKVLGQYAYPLDAIPNAPRPGGFADNGISELLAVDASHFLVLERSGSEQAPNVYLDSVRLYEMNLAGATDVSALPSLQGAAFRPLKKRLVQDLNALGLPVVDNLEGLAWGPRLANGHDTLVLVSDDNFAPNQVMQFLAFEVLPP